MKDDQPVSKNVAPRFFYLFLIVGLIAASQSGNLIRIGQAHPVAIAAWRLLLASTLMGVLAGGRLKEILGLDRRESFILILAGVALFAHLLAWITAVQHTKIANAAIFFSINPVITSIAAYFIFGERITWRLAVSIVLGLTGIAVIGFDDIHVSMETFYGDMISVVCSFLFTIYFLLGKRLRQKLDNRTYVASIYGVAAVFGMVLVFFMDLPFVDYSCRTWICFISLAIIPTAIGHTALNASLRYLDASKISAATLSEPVMAGLVAWWAWGEKVDLNDAIGFVLVSLSVLVLLYRDIWKKQGDVGS